MVFSQEPICRWHLFGPFQLPLKRYKGIHWQVFRTCWAIDYGRHFAALRTPWFAVQVASGADDFLTSNRWHGLRVYWKHTKNWQIGDGGVLFSKGDTSLSFEVSPKQQRFSI